MNPLDLRGPEFLQFYLLYGLAVFGLAWVWRNRLLSAAEPTLDVLRWTPGVYPREGDAYEIALLRGGSQEVVRTILGRLVASGRIGLLGRSLRLSEGNGPQNLPPIEASALDALSNAPAGIDISAGERVIHRAVEPYLAPLAADLDHQRLTFSSEQVRKLRSVRLMALAAILGLALVKAAVAIGRGRTNLGFLLLLTIGYAAAGYFLLAPPSHTRAARRYLSWLQESHRGLAAMLNNGRRESEDEMALAAGIYGLQALPVLGLYHAAQQPPPRRDDRRREDGGGSSCGTGGSGSDSSSMFSGDSGGGCDGGGGGGCGGGGCGGGGCGGCGG